MQLLFQQKINDQALMVYETNLLYDEKGRFRVLQFADEAVQGALDLNNPSRIVFEYPRAIIHLMEHNNAGFDSMFMIGLGIGTIATYFAHKVCKIAELSADIVELSQRFFNFDPGHVHIGDGRAILENEKPHQHDFIIIDAFTSSGTPQHLTSLSFFQLTREKLHVKGSILINLISRGEQDKRVHAIHTTLNEVYPYTKAFVMISDGRRDIRNTILIGSLLPIQYQTKRMAGFAEFKPEQGFIITD